MAKEKIMCQETTDGGASRIRGWRNTYPCTHQAKYVAYDDNGNKNYLCGIHARAWKMKWPNIRIEKLED